MDVESLLRESRLFGSLDNEGLSLVASLASEISFERGEVLCEQGTSADVGYVLREGAVGIRTHVGEGGDVLVETVTRPGQAFGWSALLEPYLYSFSARAHEAGTALALDRRPLLQLLEDRPDIGLTVYRCLANIVAGTLDQTRSSLLTVLSQGTISQG